LLTRIAVKSAVLLAAVAIAGFILHSLQRLSSCYVTLMTDFQQRILTAFASRDVSNDEMCMFTFGSTRRLIMSLFLRFLLVNSHSCVLFSS